MITRLTHAVEDRQELGIDAVQRPLTVDTVPEDVREDLDAAQAADAEWFSEDHFGADARLAWAWAPPELWS